MVLECEYDMGKYPNGVTAFQKLSLCHLEFMRVRNVVIEYLSIFQIQVVHEFLYRQILYCKFNKYDIES